MAVISVLLLTGCSSHSATSQIPVSVAPIASKSTPPRVTGDDLAAHPTAHDLPVVASCGVPPGIRPASLSTSCAYDAESITQIHWVTWNASVAIGTGFLSPSPCQAPCMRTQPALTSVTDTLNKPEREQGVSQFSSMTVKTGTENNQTFSLLSQG